MTKPISSRYIGCVSLIRLLGLYLSPMKLILSSLFSLSLSSRNCLTCWNCDSGRIILDIIEASDI